MSTPAPVFAGLTVSGAWLPSDGHPGQFTDLTGGGNHLVAAGTPGTLLPTGTPAGTPALKMNGGSLAAAGITGHNRRGSWYALLARATANGVMLELGTGGEFTLAVSGANQVLTVGGATGASAASAGQWGVYFGYCNDSYILPFFNHMNFAGPAAPAADPLADGVTLPVTFTGYWGGLVVGTFSPTSAFLSNSQMGEVCRWLYQYGLWPRARRRVRVEGDSLTGKIDPALLADSWPVQCQALVGPACQIQSLACSSGYDAKFTAGVSDRVDAAGDPTAESDQVVRWGDTNNLAFSGQTADQCYDEMKAWCQARKAANPHLRIVVATPIDRNDLGGGQAAFDAKRAAVIARYAADFTVTLAGSARHFGPAAGVAWADECVRLDLQAELTDASNATYFAGDQVHLVRAGDAVVAALFAPALLRGADPAGRAVRDYLTAPAATAATLAGLAADFNASFLGPRAVNGDVIEFRTEANALRFSARPAATTGAFAGVTRP